MRVSGKARTIALLAVGAGSIAVGPASGAMAPMCFQPTAPITYLRRPSLPFCASSRSCSSFDVSMYKNEVADYFRELRQYAAEVDQFYSDAGDYVRCMSELD